MAAVIGTGPRASTRGGPEQTGRAASPSA